MADMSPEDQKVFKIVLDQSLGFVLDSGEKLVAAAKKSSPADASIAMLVPLMSSVHATAKSSGVNVKMEVLLAAAVHVIRAMAELFVMAGLLKDSEVKAYASTVTQQAIKRHNGGQ
jgi:hypothetical protein